MEERVIADIRKPHRPCARCEEELPLSRFESLDAPFCRSCMEEAYAILRNKYSIIEAAVWRARLRRSTQKLHQHQKSKAG